MIGKFINSIYPIIAFKEGRFSQVKTKVDYISPDETRVTLDEYNNVCILLINILATRFNSRKA